MLPLIEAKYTARARATAWGKSSNGNEQIAVTFEVIEGEHAGAVIAYIKAFTDAATEYVVDALRNCGWAGDDLFELYNLDEEGCAKHLPETVTIVCKPDTYKDKTTLKVAFVNKVGAGSFSFKEATDAGDVKSFAARMKATVSALGGPRKPRLPAAQARRDDDIPF